MLRLSESFVGSCQTSRRLDMVNEGGDFWPLILTFGKTLSGRQTLPHTI
jgi:hypothetical protein